MSDAPDSSKTLPPSPNPELINQMASIAASGDPTAMANGLVAAGILPKEQVEAMIAESKKEQDKLTVFAAQIGSNTEACRLMAHAMDNWRDGVRADILRVERAVELVRRALKAVPAFSEAYDRIEADLIGREEAAKRSVGSKKVTTSGTQPKVT